MGVSLCGAEALPSQQHPWEDLRGISRVSAAMSKVGELLAAECQLGIS